MPILLGLESRFIFEVIEALEAKNIDSIFLLKSRHDSSIAGNFSSFQTAETLSLEGQQYLVPLLTPGRRFLRAVEGESMGMRGSSVIAHPSSSVSPSAILGEGSFVGALAVVASNVTAGRHLMVNRGATVGHDCAFGEFCSIGPSAALSGACEIESGVFIGTGAILLPNVKVGKNSVVGAGSVVTRDVPARTAVAGNPARVIQSEIAGYRGLGV